jgi:hypothetical protein
MEANPTQHHERVSPHVVRKGFSGKIFFLGFLILCLVIAGIIAIGRSQSLTIEHVQVVGVKTFPVQDILDYTHDYLQQQYLQVIPKSSSLFFSKKTLGTTLQKQFPVIDLVYISFVDPHTIRITIRERTPEVVWCFAEFDCGFIDRLGILYDRSPRFSDGIYTIFSSSEIKNFDNYFGKQIIEPETMYRFDQLFNQLQTEDIIVSQVQFLDNNDVAFIIERLFNRYPQKMTPILGTLGQDDGIFLRDVFTGLGHEAFKRQYFATPKDLEYIDLRFPGKVFYKFFTKQKPIEKITPVLPVISTSGTAGE